MLAAVSPTCLLSHDAIRSFQALGTLLAYEMLLLRRQHSVVPAPVIRAPAGTGGFAFCVRHQLCQKLNSSLCLPTRPLKIRLLSWARAIPIQQSPHSVSCGQQCFCCLVLLWLGGWLIDPAEQTVLVYSSPERVKVFDRLDEILPLPAFADNFRLTIGELLGWLVFEVPVA